MEHCTRFSKQRAIGLLVKGLTFLVILGTVGMLLAPAISADGELDAYREEIQRFETKILALEDDASVLLTIALLIAIFGLAASSLQALTHRYVRWATVMLGLVIASLTAVDEIAFDIDHRQCRDLALKMRRLVTDMKRDVGRLQDLPEAGRATLRQSIDAKRDAVYRLLETRDGGGVAGNSSLSMGVVHASAQSLDWRTSPPTDKSNWYFVGNSVSTDAKTARLQAEEQARNGASQAFQKPLLDTLSRERAAQISESVQDETGRLARYLADIAEVVDDWIEYDQAEAQYKSYVLLKLNRRYAESSAALFGARGRTQNSEALVAAFRQLDSNLPTLASTPEDRGAGVIRTRNTSRRIDSSTWGWTLFIEANDETLASVSHVEYHLHPTFPEPIQVVRERGHASGRGFELPGSGWGVFVVDVRVFYKSGQVLYLLHQLTFDG